MTKGRKTATEQVILAVAETTGTDPLDLPPLYDTIDSDALDTLADDMTTGTISFTYVGYDITVHSDGTATIDEPRTDHPTPGTARSDD